MNKKLSYLCTKHGDIRDEVMHFYSKFVGVSIEVTEIVFGDYLTMIFTSAL